MFNLCLRSEAQRTFSTDADGRRCMIPLVVRIKPVDQSFASIRVLVVVDVAGCVPTDFVQNENGNFKHCVANFWFYYWIS